MTEQEEREQPVHCNECKERVGAPHLLTCSWYAKEEIIGSDYAAHLIPDRRKEAVNHPDHYNMLGAVCLHCQRPIEAIDVVERMSFNVGNAVKYLWRVDHKERPLEDLEKAKWYVDREIQLRKIKV